jgi:hypothetical protein
MRMTSFSAPESRKASQKDFGNKERRGRIRYLSLDPVMYAHKLTSRIVRQAPANPESRTRELRNAGNIEASAGITYVAVVSAMIPAANPNMATKMKIFNLSPIKFTFG